MYVNVENDYMYVHNVQCTLVYTLHFTFCISWGRSHKKTKDTTEYLQLNIYVDADDTVDFYFDVDKLYFNLRINQDDL